MLKTVPDEFLKSRAVRWTRMRRASEPWNRLKKESGWDRLKKDSGWNRLKKESGWDRLKKESGWNRLKKDSGWNRLKKESGLSSGWVRMTRSPRVIDKFGRIL